MHGVTRRSLVDQVIDQMREAIASGQWRVGDRIPAEPDLIAAFGVARNTMREAVRALAHTGVLEVRHGDGTFVRAHDETEGVLQRWLGLEDLLDVLTARRGIEVEAARQAAERRTPSDLERLAKTRPAPGGVGGEAEIASAMEFHAAVVAASHNPVLVMLHRVLAAATLAGMRRTATDPTMPDIGGEAHEELLAAIRDRDPRQAGRSAARHLEVLVGSVRRQLSD
jgi:DNA-binding FadR family transcriptional regulator